MTITCCHNCENRHEKCHAHCDDYLTQKILKIMVEAQEKKKREMENGIYFERQRRINKILHENHLKRRK